MVSEEIKWCLGIIHAGIYDVQREQWVCSSESP